MSGAFPTGRPRFDRRGIVCALWVAACIVAALGSLRAQDFVTVPPTATPPASAPPTFPVTEPALPADPTAPNTLQSPAAPNASGIPLIPTQPLAPAEPIPRAGLPAAPLVGSGALPGGALADPGALPANPSALPEGAATTNNIGTARRFQYAFAVTLGATYDNNIFLEPGGVRGDLYFTLQPGVTLGFGGGYGGGEKDNLVRFSYSPQVLLYVDHPELDTVQHFVNLFGVYHFNRLTVRGAQDVEILDSTDVGNPHPSNQLGGTVGTTDPNGGTGTTTGSFPVANNPVSSVNLDVGQRTRENLYNTSLLGNYYVSDKVSVDVSGQLSVSDYAGALLSNTTLSGSGFFNYSPTGKTTLGLGVTAGYVIADRPNPDQSFEQGNLRLSYVPSSKFVFSGQVGLELRQSSDEDNTEVTPVFDLSVSYNPFDSTAISLTGSRQTLTSAVLGGQDYRTTGLTLGVSQRFFQKFFLRLSVGYTHSEYVATVVGVSAARTDDYFFLQPGLDYNVRDNLSVGAFYSHRESTSSQTNRDFSDDQGGGRVSFSF